jgi:hypothetical protein
MPALDGPLGAAKDLAERNIANDMLDPDLAALFEEYQRGASPEARLVRGFSLLLKVDSRGGGMQESMLVFTLPLRRLVSVHGPSIVE